jgi:hypothetical protein
MESEKIIATNSPPHFCDAFSIDFMVTTNFFLRALASIFSQPIRSSHEDESGLSDCKNQDKAIDHGSGLTVSFSILRRGTWYDMRCSFSIMSTFVNIDGPVKNIIRFLKVCHIPENFRQYPN